MFCLGDVDFFESYDKGVLGFWKMFVFGVGSIIEMLGRGVFGGVLKKEGVIEKVID